jgi:hypothetical protein
LPVGVQSRRGAFNNTLELLERAIAHNGVNVPRHPEFDTIPSLTSCSVKALHGGLILRQLADVVALIDAQDVPAVRGPYKKKTAEISN